VTSTPDLVGLLVNANSPTDLVRLLVIPFFAWAAYTDVKTRRIPNKVWWPLFAAGVVLLAVTIQSTYATSATFQLERDLAAIAVSLGVVAPVTYLFWLFGGFGGADAKALLVLCLLVPIYPAYEFVGVELPMYRSALGSFAFTILTNTVLVGVLYPVALFGGNALRGEFSSLMVLGKRTDVDGLESTYGSVMGSNDGMSAGKLDLDALRMYLTWRDASLDAIRADPATYRDPDSLPEDRNDPGDGGVPEDDSSDDGGAGPGSDEPGPEVTAEQHARNGETNSEGRATDSEAETVDSEVDPADSEVDPADSEVDTVDSEVDPADREVGAVGNGVSVAPAEAGDGTTGSAEGDDDFEDPWGAERFLEEIEGDAYGTTPAALRDGLDVLSRSDAVWVSPGIPFIVPMFFGLVLAYILGDVVTAIASLL
jgi:preflagellin peptidase FlaK